MLQFLLVVAICAFDVVSAHTLQQQVLSSFVFTRFGDRTPLYLNNDISILTPFGAQQMYNAGSGFRARYLTSTFDALDSTPIRDISRRRLNADEISILTIDNQYAIASAQAFMQGLYPPLADDSNQNYTDEAGVSDLANGTNIVAPLNGYQYPKINTASSYDLRSVWINGAQMCPAYTARRVEYYNSSDYAFLHESTLDFYQGLKDDFLDNAFSPSRLGYFDAYRIYDYLRYQYLHNSTVRNTISDVAMTRAEILAANWVYALYNNATDPVKSIAGRSLASQIVWIFNSTINNEGRHNKLNLWFGDFAPMVSFAALAGLTSDQNAVFYDVPPLGSSYIFELVSLLPEGDPDSSFPATSDMYVRFYFQNGTDEYSRPIEYPLFGRGPSQTLIPYSEFVKGISEFSLSGIREWCETCGAYSIFCPAFTGVDSSTSRSKRHDLSPVVAGVIGAVVALAVAGILFGLLMAVAGFRVHRQGGKTRSGMAGFRGSRKLASDQDLTIPKGGAGAVVTSTEDDPVKGHERIGSWELRDKAKAGEAGHMGVVTTPPRRRPSYEDDEIQVNPYTPAVKPHDQV